MKHRQSKKFINDHDFYCVICGKKGIPVCRTSNHNKKTGHLKKLYCLNCKKEVNHAECKDGTNYSSKDFYEEFNRGTFDADGIRISEIKTVNENVYNPYYKGPMDYEVDYWLKEWGCL